jgi:hypothetical protein
MKNAGFFYLDELSTVLLVKFECDNFYVINSYIHQTCVFSQSERLLSSNQKCLSRLKRSATLSSVKSD